MAGDELRAPRGRNLELEERVGVPGERTRVVQPGTARPGLAQRRDHHPIRRFEQAVERSRAGRKRVTELRARGRSQQAAERYAEREPSPHGRGV